MDALIRGTKLSASNKDHKLIGQWFGRRECHVAPDWLLIYLLKNDEIVFERTGSHAELFE